MKKDLTSVSPEWSYSLVGDYVGPSSQKILKYKNDTIIFNMSVLNKITSGENQEKFHEEWFKEYKLPCVPTTKIGTFSDFRSLESAIGDFV
jgi:hypothetical protein